MMAACERGEDRYIHPKCREERRGRENRGLEEQVHFYVTAAMRVEMRRVACAMGLDEAALIRLALTEFLREGVI